jgi:hypothetical protein
MAGWDTDRPIYDRLPGENEGYRKDEDWDGYDAEIDPPIARWLTAPWDSLSVELKGKIEALYTTHFNPETADAENLDWLAQLAGFTGEYWSSDWDESVKRQLILYGLDFIWESKGSRELLEWLIELFGLQSRVYFLGEFLAGITLLPATLGGNGFSYYLLVSLAYLRTSPEWAMLERLNRLFGAVYCESRVCYDQFYAGFSLAGDPCFDPPI